LNGCLLDTNVLSEILKKRPEPKVLEPRHRDVRRVDKIPGLKVESWRP
jgi:predicted nucleic acid-binding protein